MAKKNSNKNSKTLTSHLMAFILDEEKTNILNIIFNLEWTVLSN